ncbi:GNAT family N-acetyltransferase [Sphingomonas sp. HF-S4]|uniref:GNAT family N-acetyltransferase n=1 Tax=Sphingomonas agrestis TaxID=3080540 RepID=A0ABU3YCD1_9SPHN|nr:GNAT family N-acetyltransferase [Sphingomonas sp. HF-S4]MDV3458828.1 GNAT family N-acetyltransferase [Sphingomonas sp. HF-S4]
MSDVRNNEERSRFELEAEGHTAFAAYAIDGDVITFTHTVVPPALQGMGVGSKLIAGALGEARSRGLKVRPDCTFVAAYIAKHPEWQDLRV